MGGTSLVFSIVAWIAELDEDDDVRADFTGVKAETEDPAVAMAKRATESFILF